VNRHFTSRRRVLQHIATESLTLERAVSEYALNDKPDEKPLPATAADAGIRTEIMYNPKWIAVAHDFGHTLLRVDMDPAPAGHLVNYDIHWNPVRIIQRFGRIDRIGSPNTQIQLVNFWPNIELEEYINLEQRVSGRMVLLDISATGEENLIEQQSGNQMNDLEYRRKQLLKLQDAVIDLEDLSSGVSIADLTLTDFRIELAGFVRDHPYELDKLPLGTFAVTTTAPDDADIAPGVIFCLRAAGEAAKKSFEPGYPLAPHYLVHVGDDGATLLAFTQAKPILDRLRRLCVGRELPDAEAVARFETATRGGEEMTATQGLLAAAVASIAGKSQERAVASLFVPGGTHAAKGEFAGMNDFEVVAFFVVLPDATA
jgi:hypothetical protein